MSEIDKINTTLEKHKLQLLNIIALKYKSLPDDIIKYIIDFLPLHTIHKIVPFPCVVSINEIKRLFCEKNFLYYLSFYKNTTTASTTASKTVPEYMHAISKLKKIQFIQMNRTNEDTDQIIHEKTDKRIRKELWNLLPLAANFNKLDYNKNEKIYKEY